MYGPYIPETDSILVTGNAIQGSDSLGVAFPSINCDKKSQNAFYNNEVGSCADVGVIVNHPYGKDVCSYFGNIAVYHALKCLIQGANTDKGLQLEKVRTAECWNGVIQRIGTVATLVNYGIFENSWHSSLARLNCPDCYEGVRPYCRNSSGYVLQTASHGVEKMPIKLNPMTFDVLCVPTSPRSSQFLRNVEYHNVFTNYSDPLIQDHCYFNSIFDTQPASSDATASHYLTNVFCTNCDKKAFATFREPNIKWRGWFGGCGDFDCTGPKNVLIVDFSGRLFSNTAISRNEYIAPALSDTCTK